MGTRADYAYAPLGADQYESIVSAMEVFETSAGKKIVSPLLDEFFYKRGYDERATTAIGVSEVESAVLAQLEAASVANQVAPK